MKAAPSRAVSSPAHLPLLKEQALNALITHLVNLTKPHRFLPVLCGHVIPAPRGKEVAQEVHVPVPRSGEHAPRLVDRGVGADVQELLRRQELFQQVRYLEYITAPSL